MKELTQALIDKITNVLKDEVDLLIDLLHFISTEDGASYANILEGLMNSNLVDFKIICKKIANKALESRDDKEFKKIMSQVSINPSLGGPNSDDLELTTKNTSIIGYNFIKTLSRVDPKTKALIVKAIAETAKVSNTALVTCVSNLSKSLTHKYAGEVLLGVYLTYEAIISIIKWWNGEISGARCTKQIIDTISSGVGCVGGGFAGAAVGGLLGPIGLIIGSVAGGILGSALIGKLSEWLTCNLFNLPKTVALENAFKFMQLNPNASNSEVNAKFRELCLRYHPDKGGDAVVFNQLQCSMAVIRASRGAVVQ